MTNGRWQMFHLLPCFRFSRISVLLLFLLVFILLFFI
jgi:hypothetical protein